MKDKEKQREYNHRRHEEALPAYKALMSCYPLTLDDLDGEVWKDIDGYNGVYQISTFGRVKSFKGKMPRILTPQLPHEYLLVKLFIDNTMKNCLIHVLVAETFITNPDKKPEVNHDDGHKFNCHVSNLYWATRAENMQHAFDNGLKFNVQGIEDSNAKIKDEKDIIYIRDNPDNLTQEQLAQKFGMNQRAISRIQLGKTYANAGGTIRQAKPKKPRVPDEVRAQIKADWATGQYSKSALARKYGVSRRTVDRILNETA